MKTIMRLLSCAALLCCAPSLISQTLISPWPTSQFLDNAGKPLVSGRVYTSVAGSDCPGSCQTTYNSSSGFTANQNPIILDGAGRAPTGIWLTPGASYRFRVTTSAGTTLYVMDNIMGALTTAPPVPVGGANTNIQFNNFNAFGGSNNFTWDNVARRFTVVGVPGQASIVSTAGFIQSAGGFLSSVPAGGSWQGFNSNTDGALLRGYHVAQSTSNNAGGYIAISPITYNPNNGSPCTDAFGNTVQQPVPLNGLAGFGAHNVLLWVGTSPAIPASGCGAALPVETSYGLDTNAYVFARGGFATDITAYNSFQSLTGGAYMKLGYTTDQALYPKAYNASTSLNNPAAGYGGWAYKGGNSYWFYNSTTAVWASVDLTAGGGGSSVAGADTQVQYNNAGAFGASANLTWANANHLLTITALDAAHPGLVVGTGFGQFDGGVLATGATCTNYNCIQAPGGGVYALGLIAKNYLHIGNSTTGIPPLTTGDSLSAGTAYWDCGASPCSAGTGAPKMYNGAAWVTLATGGATSPGGANTNVQFNGSGSFAGSGNLTYASQLLTSVAASASVAGMAVQTGFMQADAGFLATTATCLTFNCIQSPGGGMFAKSFTALNYMQLGNYSSGGVGSAPTLTSGDTFHQGAIAYDSFGSSGGVGGTLRVFDGANWNAVGGGGGGSAALPVGGVQYNGGATFAATSNFTWTNASQLLSVTGITSTAGIALTGGAFFQATGTTAGYAAPTATQFNAFNAPSGGAGLRSVTSTVYTQVGTWSSASTSTPVMTSGDAIHAGTLSWDTNAGTLKVYNGATMVALATGGLASLNGLTGGVSIVGTANQVNVGSGGSTITLSTPQNIATSSAVNFASVGVTGAFTSSAAGASLVFQGNGGTSSINGNGVISALSLNINGGAGNGVNVTGNNAFNSLQNLGGGNFCSSATCAGSAVSVAGTAVINSGGQFVGPGVNVGINGISAGGYNISGGFIGQTWNLGFPAPFTINGAGSFSTLVIKGGVVTGAF